MGNAEKETKKPIIDNIYKNRKSEALLYYGLKQVFLNHCPSL